MSTTYATKIQNSNNTKPNHKLITTENYLKNGYSLIKRNPFTKKIEISYSSNYDAMNKEREQKRYKQGIETMISRWNNYRDELNDLLGDISPYFNYKEIIQKMIDEDNYILEKMYSRKNISLSDNDSEYYSEEDTQFI